MSYHHICHNLLVRQRPTLVQCRREDHTRVWIPAGRDPCGPLWWLAATHTHPPPRTPASVSLHPERQGQDSWYWLHLSVSSSTVSPSLWPRVLIRGWFLSTTGITSHLSSFPPADPLSMLQGHGTAVSPEQSSAIASVLLLLKSDLIEDFCRMCLYFPKHTVSPSQDTAMSKLWFKQDDKFFLPKACLNFEFFRYVKWI